MDPSKQQPRRTAQIYRRLVELCPDGMAEIDRQLVIQFVNPAAAIMLGYDGPQDMIGRNVKSLLDSEQVPRVLANIQRSWSGKQLQGNEYLGRRKDGSSIRLEVNSTPLMDDDGDIVGTLAVLRDVTEQHRAVQCLAASEGRYHRLFDEARDGIALADADTSEIIECNQALADLVGRQRHELVGRSLRVLQPPPLQERDFSDNSLKLRDAEQLPSEQETELVTSSGELLEVNMRISRLDLAGREVWMALFQDITERRRAQAQLALADRMASVGVLAAGVAHEINNPLTYVIHNLGFLQQDLQQLQRAVQGCRAELQQRGLDRELPDHIWRGLDAAGTQEMVQLAGEVAEGARRVKGITEDLGTFAHPDQDHEVELSINAVMDSAINMIQREIKYRARLVRDYSELPATVSNDGRLSQVFLNLLVNASQAITEGDAAGNEIRVRTHSEEGELLVEVSDTGHGIAPEHMSRLFDPFFTTKQVGEGSGLGLAICHNIVTDLGGSIEAHSEPGQGSRFVVRLPLRMVAPAPQPPEDPPVVADTPRLRVLVVDDDPQVMQTLGLMLGQLHQVVTVGSGAAAQQQLLQDAAFDVVVCDLMMPDITGMDLHQWVTQQLPEVASRMVFVTGGAFTPKARQFLATIGNTWLRKPLSAKVLLAAVSRVAAKR